MPVSVTTHCAVVGLVAASLVAITTSVAAPAAASVPCFTGGTLANSPYVIPASGVTGIRATVYGNQGTGWLGMGGNGQYFVQTPGGAGSVLTADIPTSPGQTVQAGTLSGASGGRTAYAGGGYFQPGLNGPYETLPDPGGSGGAAQFVEVVGSCATALAVAGGGGGAGAMDGGGAGGNGDIGSGAGQGHDGGSNSSKDGSGGGGASASGGGGGGARGTNPASACHDGSGGQSGGAQSGGTGADSADSVISPSGVVSCNGGAGAGGGGAGYYYGGGGGSGFNSDHSGGGGGGSSYVAPGGTVVSRAAFTPTYITGYPGPTIVPITNTTTLITTSKNPSVAGESITISASVTRDTGGNANAGTVDFSDGTTFIGSGTVSNGVATFVTPLTQGTHSLQAFYRGGSNATEVDNPSYSHGTVVGGVILPYQQRVDAPPPPPAPPVVTANPADLTVSYGSNCSFSGGVIVSCGDNASFSAAASGVPGPSVQWQLSTNGGSTYTNISGEIGASISLRPTVAQSGKYRAVFTNASGTATTTAATLVVNKATLRINANGKSMNSGSAVPALDVTYGDAQYGAVFRNGDTTSSLTGTLSCSTTATSSSPPGAYPITCSGLSSPNYDVVFIPGVMTVNHNAQTISFDIPAGFHYVGDSVVLTATGGASGNPVTFTIDSNSAPGSCSLNGSTLLFTGVTSPTYCIVDANQAGTATFDAAAQVLGYASVYQGSQIVTITAPSQGVVGQSVTVSATGGKSGNPVVFSIVGAPSTICSVTGTTMTYLGVGQCYLLALQAGNANYNAGAANLLVTVGPNTQAITFTPTTTGKVGASTTLSATGGPSGKPVTFSVDATTASGVCAVSGTNGTMLSYTGLGNCVLDADQAGNTVYSAAPRVQATVTVGPGAQSITFAGPGTGRVDGSATLSATGGASGNPVTFSVDASTADGVCSVSGTTVSYTAVGSCVLAADQAASTTYNAAPRALATVTVGPGAQTITFTGPGTGNVGGTATLSATGGASNVPVVFSIDNATPSGVCSVSGSTGATLNYTGVGTCTVDADQAASTQYSAAPQVTQSVVVSKAILTVTASSTTMAYGSAVPVITASYSGYVNGDTFAALQPAATCTTTAVPTSTVGQYPSSCSGVGAPNYIVKYVDGTVGVTPALLTVTATSPTTTYGDPIPSITAQYSAFADHEGVGDLTSVPTCATSATSASHTGQYATTCSGGAATNYSFDYVAGAVTIGKAPLTVTASSSSTTYGATVPAVTPSYQGLVNGDGDGALVPKPTCSTTATSSSPVAAYPSTCAGAVGADYLISYVAGAAAVTKAPLTITASDGQNTYGATPPTIVASYSGFVNREDATALSTSPTCQPNTTAKTPVGAHLGVSSCSGAASSNYAIAYLNGAVTVAPAGLTITASDGTNVYGSAAPAITASYYGFVNNETATALTTAPACTANTAPTTAVGTHPNVSTCSGAVDTNYVITYVKGTVTVTPAPLTITASAGASVYGAAPPSITASYQGFVNSETAASLAAAPTCTANTSTTTLAGTYSATSTCSGAHDPRYSITYVAGTVTIAKAATSTTVTTPATTLALSAAARFTAVVTPNSGSTVPGGTITFYLDGSSTASATVVMSGGQATYTTTFGGGAHSVRAAYSGNANYLTSTSAPALSLAVPCATTITGVHSGLALGAGLTCVARGAKINGSIIGSRGSSLDIEGATVTGQLTLNAAAGVRICGSKTQSMTIAGSTGFVLVGDAANNCAANTVTGGITAANNKGGLVIVGNTVSGSVTAGGNAGSGPLPGETSPVVSGNHH